MTVKLVSEEGTFPLQKLFERSSFSRACIWPTLFGILPVKSIVMNIQLYQISQILNKGIIPEN
jgi:hypothetical protein